ncbi:MAG: hypothetical protein KDB96_00215 [Flavobacteriales bacterium]|nr:hypothetical protein [Flavobacteriales bacterium]
MPEGPELCRTAVQHAVDRRQPALGRSYLWRLWSEHRLRRHVAPRVLLRLTLLVRAPWIARLVHRSLS